MTDLTTCTDAELRAEANRRGFQLNSAAFSEAAAHCIRLADKIQGEVEMLRLKVSLLNKAKGAMP